MNIFVLDCISVVKLDICPVKKNEVVIDDEDNNIMRKRRGTLLIEHNVEQSFMLWSKDN